MMYTAIISYLIVGIALWIVSNKSFNLQQGREKYDPVVNQMATIMLACCVILMWPLMWAAAIVAAVAKRK